LKSAVLSEAGKRSASCLPKGAGNGPFEVVRDPNGKCNCGYEDRDPESYHFAGCPSLFATILLLGGREQVVLREHITMVTGEKAS